MAILAALLLLQSGGSFDDAQEGFRDWQSRMLRDRAETTEPLRRIMGRKIVVPPPDVRPADDRTSVRMDFGSMDPLGLLPGAPVVSSRIGQPTAAVKLQGKFQAYNLFAFEHRRLLWSSADDGTAAFWSEETVGGLDAGPAGGFRPFGKFLFGVAGHDLAAEPKGGLELKYGVIGAEINVDADGKLEASAQVGPDFVPKAFKSVAEARIVLSVEAAAPVVVSDVQWRSKWGVAQAASGGARAVSLLLSGEQPCVYCARKGTVVCRQCADRGIVACPDCARSGRIGCSTCGRSGRVSCPPEKSCGRCSGSGVERCSSCSGSGSRTVYDTVPTTETRTGTRPVQAGFNSAGDPIYKSERYTYEVQTTKSVSRSESCGSCGGSGRGGSCGRCGGSGTVTCASCGGSGKVACDDCDGVGSHRCRRCGGELDIRCPTCRGSAHACPLCGGKGSIGR